MQAVDNKYSPETCERLTNQIINEFFALEGAERIDRKADTLLYDLACLYPSASDEIARKIEETFQTVCRSASEPLQVMIRVYHTVSRVTVHSRLCTVVQNLITETADTLEEWRDVFTNESPSPSMDEAWIKKNNIIPGTLKNIALQQILLKWKKLDDVALVVRNSTQGSVLHTNALLKQITLQR